MRKILPLIIILFTSCSKDVTQITIGDPFNAISKTSSIKLISVPYSSANLGITLLTPGDDDANELREELGPDLPVPVSAVDTLSDDFEIEWQPVNAKFVAAGIFSKPPDVGTIDGNVINNSNDCVWLWNSGFGTGNSNHIAFDDGKSVSGISNGQPVYAGTLVPLTRGKKYYLMLWAWNDDATRIEYSSKLAVLYIKIP
jgi:hypothetical protein